MMSSAEGIQDPRDHNGGDDDGNHVANEYGPPFSDSEPRAALVGFLDRFFRSPNITHEYGRKQTAEGEEDAVGDQIVCVKEVDFKER